MTVELTDDAETARRAAFIIAQFADRLGLPATTDMATLLQEAMQRPEAVNPDHYEILYRLHTAAPPTGDATDGTS